MDAGSIAASTGAWAWKEFGESFKDWTAEILKRKFEDAKEQSDKLQAFESRWMDFNWGAAAGRYQERMQTNHGKIRVLGTTGPVDFKDIFTDVQILPKPQAFRRFDITQLQELQREPGKHHTDERIPGLRVVVQERGRRLFILGKPGAGKTTFLKYLVHQTMVSGLDKIPIFITLKDWADSGLDLMVFIAQQFDICHFPAAGAFIEYVLETGRAVLLFDGLDEVRQEEGQRDRTITALHNFCRKHNQTQAIITCRVAATDYSFTEFTYIEMADFDDAQVKTYARKWFGADPEKAGQFLAELVKPENKGVRDLGRSPLLLSLICLAFDETMHIPRRRVELYEESLDALLKKWDASKKIRRDEIYEKLSLGRKRQMLALIAAQSFEKGEIFFPRRQLSRQIKDYLKNLPPADAADDPDGEVVLRAIAAQHGIFNERASGIYAFAHLTFQEYYTAKYIADNAHRGTLPRLMEHISDDRWREVFLLTASLMDEAGSFFSSMLPAAAGLIQEDETLQAMGQAAARQAARVEGFQPAAVRSAYWFLNLARAPALDLTLDPTFDTAIAIAFDPFLDPVLDPALYLALYLALDSTFDIAIYLAFDLAFDLAPALYLARALYFARALYYRDAARGDAARDLAHALDRISAQEKVLKSLPPRSRQGAEKFFRDFSIHNALTLAEIFALAGDQKRIRALHPKLAQYFGRLAAHSQTISPALSRLLTALPPQEASNIHWETYHRDLRALAIQDHDIGRPWKLSYEQTQRVRQYLRANQLLVDCLGVAYVNDREGILGRVLMVDPDPKGLGDL